MKLARIRVHKQGTTMIRSILVVASCIALSGCLAKKTRTHPPVEPSGTYQADGSWQDNDGSIRSKVPTAKTADQAIGRATAYAETYAHQAGVLHYYSHVASETSFSGAVTSVIGGLTKSPELVVGGAVLAAGGGAAEARYQYKVQSENYLKAADALYCMERVMVSETGSLETEGRAAVIDLKVINKEIDGVVSKLGRAQMAIVLATPDFADLETAVNLALGRSQASEAADVEAVGELREEPAVEAEGVVLRKGVRRVHAVAGDLAKKCIESRNAASQACRSYVGQDANLYTTDAVVISSRSLRADDQVDRQERSATAQRMAVANKVVDEAAKKARDALSAEVIKCAASY